MIRDIFKILTICGTCISFYIGAGFATMQEIMQYEVSYGSLFPIVITTTMIIYIYTNLSFTINGNRLRLLRGGEIYEIYCRVLGKQLGKIVSTFFDYFSAFFCFMSYVVMCGGANSTLTQQWGFPYGSGAIGLSILVVLTVIYGLQGIIKSLGKLGPLIIILLFLVSIIAAVTGWDNFRINLDIIDAGFYKNEIKQVGDGNPFISGISYGGFVILWFAAFLSEIGAKEKLKLVNMGMLLSSFFIFGAAYVCCIALIGHIDVVVFADIPALILATQISPMIAVIFAIIICIGIYTSATPLLWTSVRKIAREETKKYKLVTILMGIIGCGIACFVPYKGLINVLYGINGYLGFILFFVMIYYDITTKMSKRIGTEK